MEDVMKVSESRRVVEGGWLWKMMKVRVGGWMKEAVEDRMKVSKSRRAGGGRSVRVGGQVKKGE